jgi:tRNA modification GTPase
MTRQSANDTIVAIATAHGAAGVGIVRLSGPDAAGIAGAITGAKLPTRRAIHARFLDEDEQVIDDGIAIYFAGPRSYTGEDVVELQAHGSPVLLSQLLKRCIALGARMARPGEFTERAFLEGKLDLAQAEAVADLIAAGSEAAARAARRSLDGEFSRRVDDLVEQLTQLRMYVEAALDFPDEDIDFLAAPVLSERLTEANTGLSELLREAQRGKRLIDGTHVVIIGAPNVGKSSLLNALAAEDRAIVSDIAGTTRDLLRENLSLDGVALTLVDTAGLRAAPDTIEAEGIRRARAELARADIVLAMLDDRDPDSRGLLAADLAGASRVLWLHNKCDLGQIPARVQLHDDGEHLWLSALTGAGLEALRDRLRGLAGGEGTGSFSARSRHVEALTRALVHLAQAKAQLSADNAELTAEELRQAQLALGQITGHLDADGLLGRIFSGFCIGK